MLSLKCLEKSSLNLFVKISMETTVSLVVKTLNEKMGLNLENRDIDIAHRMGKKIPNQPARCIIAKFISRVNKMKSLRDRKRNFKEQILRSRKI